MIGMTRVNSKLTRMEKHPAEAMVAKAGCFIYKLVEMPLLYLKLNSAAHTYTKHNCVIKKDNSVVNLVELAENEQKGSFRMPKSSGRIRIFAIFEPVILDPVYFRPLIVFGNCRVKSLRFA